MKKIVIVNKGVTAKEVAKVTTCCADGAPAKIR